MQTVGLFTIALWAVRKVISFLPKIFEILTTFSGGLISQLLVLFFCIKILPLFVELFVKGVQAFVWLLHKFE